jgi:hypothetical protein
MTRDPNTGRFIATKGHTVTAKGYIRLTAGPLRHQYEHRVVAAKKIGRPLTKNEDTHHRNRIKHDNDPSNIQVLGHREHGCVSALQHWYLDSIDVRLKSEWNSYFSEEKSRSELNVEEGSEL